MLKDEENESFDLTKEFFNVNISKLENFILRVYKPKTKVKAVDR